jgi:carotenoid cleavage dioxygenase-like enzyme
MYADTVAAADAAQTTISTTPDMTAFSNGYKTVFNEISCALAEPTVGALPLDLVGTYYKCGPAMFSA